MDIFEKADSMLKILDEAPVGTLDALFQNQSGKEWMETAIWRAVIKFSAAKYHAANITRYVEDLQHIAQEATTSLHTASLETFGSLASATMQSRTEQNQIAYELDAFLAAGRACIDFVANVLALHVKGMNRRTGVTTLLKTNGPHFPFHLFLSKWKEWIEEIKEYRDECIHYRTIRLTGGYKAISRGGKIATAAIPVVVPETVLADVPDTRRRRMALFDVVEVSGLGEMTSCATIQSDGKDQVYDIQLGFIPARGYIPVEQFCDEHLARLQNFICESFDAVAALQFRGPAQE